MNPLRRHVTPARVVLLTLLIVVAYILILGPNVVLTEFIGTLILFPGISASLLPAPLNQILLSAMSRNRFWINIFSIMPLLVIAGASLCAAYGIWKHALVPTYVASALILTTGLTYHFAKQYCFVCY